jgi:O-antigen/teichoic acid export membrane protein
MTGLVAASSTIVLSIPLYYDLFRLLRKEKIPFQTPNWQFGYSNFVLSLAVSGKGILENSRQQGVRLIIAPFVGTIGLTAFSTMRTASNVALQGLNTVIYPLMPELMRFLHARDQVRSETSFGTVWFVLVAFMAPAMLILQAFIQPLYHIWTHGRVTFNPFLFAILSLSVLVFAVAQPAMAVVRGNNLLRPQLAITLIAAIVVIGLVCLLVPRIGLIGGGIALMASEIAANIGYKMVAKRWLNENGLVWPRKPFLIATISIWIVAAAMGGIILLPKSILIILIISLILLFLNAWRYWKILPQVATQNVKNIISGLPVLKRIFPANV